MKRFMLLVLVMSMLFSGIAFADIGAVQLQLQGTTQNQTSLGGASFSGQSYGTGQNQTYTLNKYPTFFSPSAGVATGTTAISAGGAQFKFGSGFQNQNSGSGSLNGGGLLW